MCCNVTRQPPGIAPISLNRLCLTNSHFPPLPAPLEMRAEMIGVSVSSKSQRNTHKHSHTFTERDLQGQHAIKPQRSSPVLRGCCTRREAESQQDQSVNPNLNWAAFWLTCHIRALLHETACHLLSVAVIHKSRSCQCLKFSVWAAPERDTCYFRRLRSRDIPVTCFHASANGRKWELMIFPSNCVFCEE